MPPRSSHTGYSTFAIKKTKRKSFRFPLRGPERIRTAVGAFAELSLATRPQDHLMLLFSDFVPIFIGIRFVQRTLQGSHLTFGEPEAVKDNIFRPFFITSP